MTAADRPSVTDDARACHMTVPHGAHAWDTEDRALLRYECAGRAETTTEHEHDWKRQQNVTSKGYVMPPIEVCRIEGCDAARSAETTTATDEDAARALARAWAATAPTKTGGFDAMSPHRRELLLARSRNALEASGLLATARTRPTLEQIARAITDGFLGTKRSAEVWQQGTARNVRDNYLRAADAVLALLRGGDRDE